MAASIPDAVEGALRPSPLLTWLDEDGDPLDLTGATITARIKNRNTGVARNATGSFPLSDATAGIFQWDYSAADVADSGKHAVQFTATFGAGQSPARTFETNWLIHAAI